MNDRIEIKLTRINETPVDLNSMNAEALQSFMEVVSALKAIAENVVGKEDLKFTIRNGSALCSLEAPIDQLTAIYGEIDVALKGQSSNKEVANGLRRIQREVKSDHLGYEFGFHQSLHVKDIYGRIISASRISVKKRRVHYGLKLGVGPGTIKQIGGEHPNYHLDCENGEKRTIECTIEDAVKVNRFLYQMVNPLVLVKEFLGSGKQNEFIHLALIEEELAPIFYAFVVGYNAYDDLIERLTYIHTFVDSQFQDTNQGHLFLKSLLLGFNHHRFHLSELKTLLVISKPFQTHPLIQESRIALNETYNAKRR